ncbi:MAG: M20/M25/M40 family metallo-hydrolase [Oscillospiraceae bacterium]|jgi:tripeptide aminopeptidase|nr:M20/M25/M40 family metallo-hydrolase [Oscillospiraceae bacterium]
MNSDRLRETFTELAEIYSPSKREEAMYSCLKGKLENLGLQTQTDSPAPWGGSCGNLYAFWEGTGMPLLLSAHMDTVEPAKGKRLIYNSADGTFRSDGTTILGADDCAGLAIILEAIARIKESGAAHRPAEILFTAAEEIYGLGAAAADYARLSAKEALVLDLDGPIGSSAIAAPTILSFTATIRGKAAHAGFASRDGVHAIQAAAKGIATLHLGEPEPGLTCNIGLIQGGIARNIVPDTCAVSGEIRALRHEKALALRDAVRSVFATEAAAVGASVGWEEQIVLHAFAADPAAPICRAFASACQAEGLPCDLHPTMGGSDMNHFAQHGITGLVAACSMHDVHSTREWASLTEMEDCTRLVVRVLSA